MGQTRTLNLDSMFNPVPRPEIKFELFKFPGGEVHITLRQNIDYSKITKVIITQRIRTSDDLMAILLAKDALWREGIVDVDLIIPYIPYARQDRMACDGEAFSLSVFARIINSQSFTNVLCLDVHSDKSLQLIDRLESIPNTQWVEYMLDKFVDEPLVLVSPDKGAKERSKELFKELPFQFTDLVYGEKLRDPETGKLSGFDVDVTDLKGKDCIIVDDIGDGCGTFIGLANVLKERNAGKLYLFVTHGIFSKGTEELSKVFDGIFTTNSFKDTDDSNVEQVNIWI